MDQKFISRVIKAVTPSILPLYENFSVEGLFSIIYERTKETDKTREIADCAQYTLDAASGVNYPAQVREFKEYMVNNNYCKIVGYDGDTKRDLLCLTKKGRKLRNLGSVEAYLKYKSDKDAAKKIVKTNKEDFIKYQKENAKFQKEKGNSLLAGGRRISVGLMIAAISNLIVSSFIVLYVSKTQRPIVNKNEITPTFTTPAFNPVFNQKNSFVVDTLTLRYMKLIENPDDKKKSDDKKKPDDKKSKHKKK